MEDPFKTPTTSESSKPVKLEMSPRVNFPLSIPLFLTVVLQPTFPLQEINFGKEVKDKVEWTAYNEKGERCKLTSIGKNSKEIYEDFWEVAEGLTQKETFAFIRLDRIQEERRAEKNSYDIQNFIFHRYAFFQDVNDANFIQLDSQDDAESEANNWKQWPFIKDSFEGGYYITPVATFSTTKEDRKKRNREMAQLLLQKSEYEEAEVNEKK